MRRAALLAFVLGTAAFIVFAAVPFLGKRREQPASITSPPPLVAVSLDVLRPGSRLCMGQIAIDPHSQVARFQVGTYTKPGPPLALDIRGPGYHSSARVPGGYPDNQVLSVRVRPPTHSELVRACLRNEGPVKIALYSAADRAESRAQVSLNGRSVGATPEFGFWEARPTSIADRASTTAARIAVFRGPLGYTWVLWLVFVAVVLALTAGLAAAIWKTRAAPRTEV